MDKYIGITISYTGIPITVDVGTVSRRFCKVDTSHRLIIKEETVSRDNLRVLDVIAVGRHNSYEWAIITSILPERAEVSVYIPSSGRTIMYAVLERTGRISTISAFCPSSSKSRGLYTVVKQDEITNSNHMETRNVSITLEQAREWYKSYNEALKTIALSAYKDWELEEKFEDIVKDLDYISMCRMVPRDDAELIGALVNLRKLARALNGDWVRKPKEKAWFFLSAKTVNGCVELEHTYHIESYYPTVVYFKDLRTLNRAKKFMLNEWELFKGMFD